LTAYEAAKHFRNNEDLIGKAVQIKRSDKTAYMKLIGMHGIVDRISGGTTIGVRIDDMNNEASAYGVFWFSRNEIKILDEDRKDTTKMDFKHVAMVRLFDYAKKEYAFALYDEELTKLQELNSNSEDIVLVNAGSKGNRLLGTITSIYTKEAFYDIPENKGINITAEVIGIVDMTGYKVREEEKARQKELAKKKAAIEKELEAEINKRKSIEYYEAMAKEYSDNPKLAELVAELKQLGM
jgi:hypothetical protein